MMPKKRVVKSALIQIIALALGVLIVFPILYAISLSFMEPKEILTKSVKLLPDRIQWDNYKQALRLTNIPRYMINSFILASVSSIVRIIVASLAAFSYAFFEFKGKKFLFLLSMTTMMIPGDVVLITNYKTVASLGLTNTYLGMMTVFLVNVLNIFLLRQSFLTISSELFDAAKVDGCGNLKILTTIIMPVSKPILATVFISSFVSIWNTYLWPMLVVTDNSLHTVQVGVTLLRSADGGTIYGPIMAASTMILLPTIIVFVVFQKQIVRGMTSGSVKG